jgi:hypothetical protein
MIIHDGGTKVEVVNWPVAEPLFSKWGYDVDQEEIKVSELFNILSELSAWGITWKYKD